MALLFAMVLGADSIDDCEVLRAGRTRRLLGGWLPAPSTLGTFLRAFTFGHVRQLDALLGEALVRAWRAGAGPGDGRLVIDVDSFVGEVCGRLKQGAAYGYTKLLGYHPILATRADTREVLHIRLRKGSANTQKGMLRFCEELIGRVQRAGADGVKLLRADSGFWNVKVFKRLENAGWQYSIGVRMIPSVRKAVEQVQDSAWQTIAYPEEGEAQIAETVYGGRRLIARRTRLVGAQAQLWPDWRHFAFLTNRTEDVVSVEAEHRDHAVVEQVIADLKDQALVHFPSGQFNANGAWTGFRFFRDKAGKVRTTVAPKALKRAEDRLRALTTRNWGVSMERRVREINRFTVGWTAYFALADTVLPFEKLEKWLRRRLRQVRWKEWKRPQTRYRNLLALGISGRDARSWAASQKGYWRVAGSWLLQRALPNAYWHQTMGLKGFTDPYRRFREC
jgi:Transposase DDE domain group 1/Group II intron, maturase-specific domain